MSEFHEYTEESGELFEHFRFEADKGQAPLRIDKFLFIKIANASRNRIQHAAKAGNILVNNHIVKSNYKVRPQDVITVVLAYPPRDTEIYPEEILIEIVYEDSDILIINKEAGMVVHPGPGNFTGTLLNALVYYFQNSTRKENTDSIPFLAHRIDKNTTGLLLTAKNELAQSKLAKQFYADSFKFSYIFVNTKAKLFQVYNRIKNQLPRIVCCTAAASANTNNVDILFRKLLLGQKKLICTLPGT